MLFKLLSALGGLLFWLAAGTASADIAKLYGRADGVWDAQVSPTGRYVALGCSPAGWPAICVFDLEVPGEPTVMRGADGIRLLNFYWASDRHIISNAATFEQLGTSSGLRQYEFRRAISFDVTTGKQVILLRDAGLYLDTTYVVSTCSAKPDKVLMQLSERPSGAAYTGTRIGSLKSGVRSQHYEVDLDTGRGKQVNYRGAAVVDVLVDQNCTPLVNVIYNDKRGEFALETADNKRRFFELNNAQVWPMEVVGMSDDRQSVIVRADYDDHFGLHRIRLADGVMEPVMVDGEPLGNLGVLWDDVRSTIIGFTFSDDLPGHIYVDETFAGLQEDFSGLLKKTIRIRSMSADRSMITISAESPGVPVEFYLYDANISELSPLGSIAPQLAEQGTGSVTGFTYTARDGLEIPAYLTLPPGKTLEDGPFPVLIMPHGGPESRDNATFDWWSQAYATAGYAVVQPNFRGSSGYGPEFRNAGFGEFGGKMIDDVVDAIGWAETSGLAKEGGVCVVGASYGGYAALMSALRSPQKVVCTVAVAPVTDIFMLMAEYDRDTAPHNYWARYTGGDSFQAPETRKDITPAARTADYRGPVMLIHGKSDAVVEVSQSEAFVRAWGNRAGLTFVPLDGQDHHLRSTKGRHDVLSESLRFLDENHPGRR